jgi:DNA-binding transcriptional LysR family regulator
VREQIGDQALQLRVERSLELVERLERGELDAAIVLDPGRTKGAVKLGTVALRWWASPELAAAVESPPEPFPVVAYDPPCAMRDLALGRVHELGLDPLITAESPHFTGVQAAVRSGLGYALLAAGGGGMIPAGLWLLVAPAHRGLAEPLRAALWRATTRRALAQAA